MIDWAVATGAPLRLNPSFEKLGVALPNRNRSGTSVDRQPQVERLRGMADLDASKAAHYRYVQDSLLNLMSRHGYQQVETPIVEPTELFLRKSGGERVAQMYAFRHRERDISLRPEHTASVLRMYVDSMQSSPLPLRLSYAGPVFRYEKPQAGRTRQFIEVGCELLGAEGPLADAEVIHLALAGLSTVGVSGRLVLGHVGLVLEYLNRLPLRQRARDWLIWSMERLRKGRHVDLEADLPGLAGDDQLSEIFEQMRDSFVQTTPKQLEAWVLSLLNEVGVQTEGGARSAEEIVAGVIAKLHRQSDEEDVRRGFEFVQQLAQLHGSPQNVLPELRELIRSHRLAEEPIERIERVLELLAAFGHGSETIELCPGLGRGLHYYTGMLFEIYASDSDQVQLCGGGRYDDLAETLGSRQSLPASGFTYGLERVAELTSVPNRAVPAVTLVAATEESAADQAIRIAEEMRQRGEIVDLDVRGRSAVANRRFARRAGISSLVLVAADGRVTTESIENWQRDSSTEAADDV